jgi:hypothetical protein
LIKSKLVVPSFLNSVIVAFILALSPSWFVSTWSVTGFPISPLTAVVPNLVSDFSSMPSSAFGSDAVSRLVSRSLWKMVEAPESNSNSPAPLPSSAKALRLLHFSVMSSPLVASQRFRPDIFGSATCDTVQSTGRVRQ